MLQINESKLKKKSAILACMHELVYLHMHIKAHFIKIQKIAAHTKLKMAYQIPNKIV